MKSKESLPTSNSFEIAHVPENKEQALSTPDPLRRYLEEIRAYPILEPQEEFALAIQLKDQDNPQAAKKLISSNLRLVVKIASEYRALYVHFSDLIQEGNLGLIKAVSKFDPQKGVRLSYYASLWIHSYILKYLLDNFRLVKIGTTQAQKKLFYHLMREKQKLELQGHLASPKLLAQKLHVREKDVVEMEHRLSSQGTEVSLDTPLQTDHDHSISHIDLLQDPTEPIDEVLAKNQLIQFLKKYLPQLETQLNEKELTLLHERLLADEPKRLQKIAEPYGFTRERARQIETKLIKKIKKLFEFLLPPSS